MYQALFIVDVKFFGNKKKGFLIYTLVDIKFAKIKIEQIELNGNM